MHNLVSYIIVASLIIAFLVNKIAVYLNLKTLNPNVPDEMSDVFDAEKYKKSQEYLKINSKTGILHSSIFLIFTILFIFFNGFAYVDTFVSELSHDEILQSLIFFGIIGLLIFILDAPFDIYETFVIEKKFGFNKTNAKIFIFDQIKSILITMVLGGGVGYLLLWIMTTYKDNFVWLSLIVVVLFNIFFSMFYTNLIVPMFNKLTPLPEGELRDEIEKFAKQVGFSLKNIYTIDGSKRSTKANAYFSGLGPKKTIVLYDTLVDLLTPLEVVAVLAHEIGHYKKQHILKNLVLFVLILGVILLLLQTTMKYPIFWEALGVKQFKLHIVIMSFVMLVDFVMLILNTFNNIMSRKFEYEADNFAKNNNLGEELISSLKKLSVNNLSNLTPHKFYVFLNYSHPPIIERISKLKS